ncbi:hypothetical protein CLV60_107167 [Dyadobacter jiangsuensis]|uniref:Uncharacterized protein n=2 Tax=Dyadobacter jiangsuensis TaxID=1591085 RepID=A0A2P8G1P2_9BACT|nr:hypothetical protein CLV60_107167 [Dyadobacter jiangsuensis]
MVNQVFMGEVNGVPFKTGMAVWNGAIVRQDLCEGDVIGLALVRKIQEDEYQLLYLNYFHTKSGSYSLTDSTVSHRKNMVCALDSITASLNVSSYPGDDVRMDIYRLVEGPSNNFKVLYYDSKKNEMQGHLAARFVRINKRQHGRESVDTITYTNCKFILSNIYVQEAFTEPR